ncbi:MAG: hypothetical protein AAGA90_17405 [Actinomycetota bacterium]
MSFDDRLRRQLSEQADHITIEPTDASAPAARAARRQTRRRITVAAAFLAVVGLSAAWITSQDGDPAELATEPDPDVEVADDEDPAPDDDESLDDAIADPSGADVTALTFTSVDADGAPGGYNLFSRGAADDLYYVLSTAPGLEPDRGFWRNDTLYTWTGDGWANSTFTDRFVSTIGSADGLLYTVSTGSTAGDAPAVGTSADGGDTWDWTPLDLPATLGAPGSYALADAVGPAGHLVVAWSAPQANWDEAIALARDAGLSIGWDTHHILNVDREGIRFAPAGDGIQCADEYWRRVDQAAPYPVDISDETWDGDDPTEAELARYDAALLDYEVARREAQDDVLAELTAVPECAEFADCQVLQNGWDREQEERARQIYIDLDLMAPDGTTMEIAWDEIDAETQEAIDEAFSDLYDYETSPIAEAGCEEVLYGPGFDEADVETVTWASLGVVAPDSWAGAIAAFLVEDGTVRELDTPFEPGWLQTVTATDDGFIVDLVTPLDGVAEFESEVGPDTTRWVGGADGWAASTTSGGTWTAATSPDGTTYANVWGANGQIGITRTSGDSTVTVSMDQIFGADHRSNGVSFIDAGAFGVAVASVDYDGETSVVAYSPDGLTWATTELDGYWVDGLIVGGDAVMVFAHPFGTTGNTEVFIGRT